MTGGLFTGRQHIPVYATLPLFADDSLSADINILFIIVAPTSLNFAFNNIPARIVRTTSPYNIHTFSCVTNESLNRIPIYIVSRAHSRPSSDLVRRPQYIGMSLARPSPGFNDIPAYVYSLRVYCIGVALQQRTVVCSDA